MKFTNRRKKTFLDDLNKGGCVLPEPAAGVGIGGIFCVFSAEKQTNSLPKKFCENKTVTSRAFAQLFRGRP